MTTVVGVRFREVGKIYYFAPGDLDIKVGDNVIVDTVRGTEYGTCIIGMREVEDDCIVQPLKAVRRIATPDDDERMRSNREKEKDALIKCKEKILERGLEMKLISAEYTFDNSKILFYFTADGRVDFRELVKDLAAIFRIRIELRQVGVRDETKIMGGLGGCGRELCCASYLSDFVPVSIRMAKEQNLSLNPQKISGVCGRLMCCLKNEAETYEDLNTRLPKQGDKVTTKDGREGIAETVNVLRERIRVLFTDEEGNKELEEFPARELKFKPRRKKSQSQNGAADIRKEIADDISEIADDLDIDDDEMGLLSLDIAELKDSKKDRISTLEDESAGDSAPDEPYEEGSYTEDSGSDAGKSDGDRPFHRRRRRHRRRRPNSGQTGGENGGGDERKPDKTGGEA